jgi:hypothetical protein
MELADGRLGQGSVGDAVDHEAAGSADAFAAVMIEGDGQLALAGEVVVDHIEHLEERGVLADIVGDIGLETTGCVATILAPDVKRESHGYR